MTKGNTRVWKQYIITSCIDQNQWYWVPSVNKIYFTTPKQEVITEYPTKHTEFPDIYIEVLNLELARAKEVKKLHDLRNKVRRVQASKNEERSNGPRVGKESHAKNPS